MSLGIINDSYMLLMGQTFCAKSIRQWLDKGRTVKSDPIRYGDKVKARVIGGTVYFVGRLEWVDGELCALVLPNGKFSDVFSTQSIVRVEQ